VLVDFYIARQNYESGLNGSGRVLVVRKDCFDQRQWHSSNASAYATCTLDAWFNGTYKNLLDANIRTAMGTTKFYYTLGNGNTTKTTLGRAVFALSATELGQTNKYMNTEGTALSSTVLNLLKIAYLNGSAVYQWTRSPRMYGSGTAWLLGSNGSLESDNCTGIKGSRPAFTLPSSLYVSDDGSVSVNTAPSTPGSITAPATVRGGSTLPISWTRATDSNDNLSGYELERSVNGGDWAKIYKGSALTFTDTITAGWNTVAYRVKAYDTDGLNSGWRTGSNITVINNAYPVIASDTTSGTDLGTKNDGFDLSYTVTDADNDTVTVKEYLDNVLQRSYTATLGRSNTFQAVTAANYQKILNGSHTLKVVANDGKADSAAYTVTFAKSVTTATMTLAAPLPADDRIAVMAMAITGSIPDDADLEVLVTNNANDDAPAWEDATADVRANVNHVFSNAAAANGFAFNFKITVSRGPSGQGGYISSIGGAFE